MFKFRSHDVHNIEETIDKKATSLSVFTLDTQRIFTGKFFTIYNGYFQLSACTNRTYVFNYWLPRHHFTRFHNAKAFDKT